MKIKLTIFLFVFLYLIAMLRPVAPFLEYAVNYNYISKVLCVNKNKPKLSCNGKCYLIKEIKKQENQKIKSLRILMEEYPIGFVKIFRLNNIPIFYRKTSKYFRYQKKYFFQLIKFEYHPPEN